MGLAEVFLIHWKILKDTSTEKFGLTEDRAVLSACAQAFVGHLDCPWHGAFDV